MSNPKISIATLAPPPAAPGAPEGPSLPPAPAHLHQGATGLGPLPGASITVATLPHRYMMAGIIPVVVAAALTLLGLIVPWPAPGTRAQLPPQVPAPVPPQPKPKPRPAAPVPQPTDTRPVTPTPSPGGGSASDELVIPQETRDAAGSGRPVPSQLPGVTAPVPRSLWPRVNPGPRYADHLADVTVRFVVQVDGRVDPSSIEVSGPGAAPLKDATVAAYAPLVFQPGRVGSQVVPILMTHHYRYPPN